RTAETARSDLVFVVRTRARHLSTTPPCSASAASTMNASPPNFRASTPNSPAVEPYKVVRESCVIHAFRFHAQPDHFRLLSSAGHRASADERRVLRRRFHGSAAADGCRSRATPDRGDEP